jgi:hypothetical protein
VEIQRCLVERWVRIDPWHLVREAACNCSLFVQFGLDFSQIMISKLENHDLASLEPGIYGFLVRDL